MKYLITKPDSFLNTINNEINGVLHKSFDSLFPEYFFDKEMGGMAMPVDLKEDESKYFVKVELPGVKKEDVDIDVTKNQMTVSAKKEDEKEEIKEHYHKTEFRYGDYSRTIYFPDDVNIKDIKAQMKNGVLKIELQKIKNESKSKTKIKITD